MKRLPLAALLAALILPFDSHAAKFTYHGDLMDGDAPAEGAYDLRVRSFSQPGASKTLVEPTELYNVALIDGRFSVELDLPEAPSGTTWVEIAVRKSNSGAGYEILGEPQAISKANSTCPGAWALDGNTGVPAGSFLGLADPASSTPLELRASARRVARFNSATVPGFIDAPSIALGAAVNQASGTGATVSGGGSSHDGDTSFPSLDPALSNIASGRFATIGGGQAGRAAGNFGVISGGRRNSASGENSVVAGGTSNSASANGSTVSGGIVNQATALGSTISGGDNNTASGNYSTIAGGRLNRTSGNASFASGSNTCAGGDGSWAGGYRATVRSGTGGACGTSSGDANGDEGSFIWADAEEANFVTGGPNQFVVRAAGGVGINTTQIGGALDLLVAARKDGDADADFGLRSRSGKNASLYVDDVTGILNFSAINVSGDTRFIFGAGANVSGRYLTTGANNAHLTTGGAWTNGSSRAFKQAFEAIDPLDVLARVVALPLTRWRYRDSDEGLHLGPMAEDFAAAFGLGGSAQHISTVDADGVALAAIQGLNAKLEAENTELRAQLASLATRLARLEARDAE